MKYVRYEIRLAHVPMRCHADFLGARSLAFDWPRLSGIVRPGCLRLREAASFPAFLACSFEHFRSFVFPPVFPPNEAANLEIVRMPFCQARHKSCLADDLETRNLDWKLLPLARTLARSLARLLSRRRATVVLIGWLLVGRVCRWYLERFSVSFLR